MEFPRIHLRRRGPGRGRHARVAPVILGVLLLILMSGCSNAASVSPPRESKSATEPTPVQVDLSTLPAATTFGNTAAAPSDPAPRAATDGVVLHVKQELAVYDAPEGRAIARLPATQFKSPTWLPVTAERGDWARVLLPSRPNGSTGWVRVGTAKVEKARTPYLVTVDVEQRRLVVRKNGREVGSWTVGVGSPGTRTPKGRTFILASIRETVTDFSPIILPLGTHSKTLTSYGGGPGTVAFHGWPDPSVFGTASSDGCVRVPSDALHLLRSLPLGTVVLLR
ncbi:L,D-transpeptidase [Haloactinomyces albus]|uniref:Lipoprotein-anchoring transpeptidase ErfK/SrfK n=1 Tax=Haloactinomyces albus TaxID=1352928 RepID=A0AAE3ZBD9_9ACTN|nr:L,D-transpeptidase [Haloactinomyces albus]MDR7301818.1 lipoprotein-anchoring transpeptidase ErfK/SrfK [Haloactinomyces albus]